MAGDARLLDAIRLCFASLFKDRAISYRVLSESIPQRMLARIGPSWARFSCVGDGMETEYPPSAEFRVLHSSNRCAGAGGRHCSAIGRDVNSWGAEADAIRADYQAASLGQEVERLRDAVGKRLKELDRREQLLERRERELNLLRALRQSRRNAWA